jgi:ribonuclease P protein component
MAASRLFGRLVESADFQRALAVPPCSRSAHFALHHVKAEFPASETGKVTTASEELSTPLCTNGPAVVDDPKLAPGLLGCMVPKRHARKAVTRNLFKRQIRAQALLLSQPLPSGLWLVRLRSPFVKAAFPSAASMALRQAVRTEIQQLFRKALP